MASCRLTPAYILKIDGQISDIVAMVDFGEKSTAAAKQEIQKVLESLREVTPRKEVVNAVIDIAKMNGIYNDGSIFFTSDEEIESIIKDGGKITSDVDNHNSTEILTEADRNRRAKDVKKDFLVAAYGTASQVREKAEKEAAVALCNAILVNRSKDRPHGSSVTTVKELNQNLRDYQQKLFDTILEYLKYQAKISGQDPSVYDNLKLYEDDGQGGWNYTGKLHELESKIMESLKRDRFPDAELIRLGDSTNENDKMRLNAYNAWQMLSHFDSLIAIRYGESLVNDSFEDMSFNGKDKWHRPDKGANNKTSWRTSDEIILADEVDGAIQELINSTPLLEYGSDTQLSYLQFSDFSNILAVLKDLVYSNGDYTFNNVDRFNISDSTKRTIQGKSLKHIINMMRFNPQKYLSAVFEVLSNNDIFNEIKSNAPELLLNLGKSEKDIIYSVHKGLTGHDEHYAVNGITLGDPNSTLYEELALASDSIYKISFLLYYTGQDGITRVRDMQGNRLDGLRRNIRQTIKTKNTRLIPSLFEAKANIFTPIVENNQTKGVIINVAEGLTAKVMFSDGNVTLLRNGKKTNILFNQDLLDFINLGLGLNITESIINKMPKTKAMNTQDLVNFSARVLANSYISNVLLKDKTTKSQMLTTLRTIFGENTPKIDPNVREMDLIHNNDINTIDSLANALAIEQGLYSSSQIKSGSGNSQSQQSLSRLLGSYQSQWELQNKLEGSATKGLMIMDDGILRGVYTAKEYYDLNTAKDHTDFNVKEFASSMFLQDFIGGLAHKDGYNPLLGDGIIAILPSVNSDKNTIGRLIIDTNKQVLVNGKTKKISELNATEFEQVITDELGSVYGKVINKVNDDFATVLAGTGLSLTHDPQSFDFFNKHAVEMYPQFGKTPAQVLEHFILTYNQTHRNRPISITDQIHFIKNKNGTIKTNETLLKYKDWWVDGNKQGFHDFMINKRSDIIGSLLRSGFKVDLTKSTPAEAYLKDKLHSTWIDKSTGEMVLGKFTFNGKTYYIRNKNQFEEIQNALKLEVLDVPFRFTGSEGDAYYADLINRIQNGNLLYDPQILSELHKAALGKLELNPYLEKYNYTDYLFSQEFMISTVGTLAAHPLKRSDGNLEHDEAGRFNALHKRNVSYTATMQEFALNLISGIPTDYNIAVVDDIKDIQYNVSGEVDDGIKPYDGATFVNPFIVYLENNSLGGAKAGITKKQFVHFYDEGTANGGIIKTCGFGITNDWMRNSQELQILMKKMTSGKWFDQNGHDIELDITTDYKGEKVQFKPIYFRKNGKYYRLDGIENIGGNKYNLSIVELNVNKVDGQLQADLLEDKGLVDTKSVFGELTDEDGLVTINSNYLLWQVFGGKDSLDLEGSTLKPSNTSIENVVSVMNGVGIVTSPDGEVQTQEDLYQPLKHSDIHYIATAGAVKQGGANINTNNVYDDDTPLNFMKIHMYQAGIQLDKEHHADGAELSLMTLVINACAHAGYSMDDSMEMFKALRTLTDVGTDELLRPLREYVLDDGTDETHAQELHQAVVTATMNTVLKALSKQSFKEDDLLQVFAQSLLTQIRDGKLLKYSEFIDKLPVDNPAVYSKFMSTISVFLTNSGIKMKIPGILSVLTPSYGIMKIFTIPDGKGGYKDVKWEQIESNEQGLPPVEYLESLQEQMPYVFNNLGMIDLNQLKIGKTYRITYLNPLTLQEEVLLLKLTTPRQYKQLKELILSGTINIKGINYLLKSFQVDIQSGRELGNYNVYFKDSNSHSQYLMWDFDSIQALYELKDIIDEKDILQKGLMLQNFLRKYKHITGNATNTAEAEKVIRATVRHDLAAVSDNGSDFYDNNQIYIDGQLITPDLTTVEREAYELVLPKLFVHEFGLEENDLLNEIKDNPEFFTQRLLKNIATHRVNSDNYDIALLNASGKHYHIVESLVGTHGLQQVPIHKFLDDDGKVYRVDEKGNEIYELAMTEDSVYIDEQGNEIIVTKNPKFYVDHLSYATAEISDQYDAAGIEELLDMFKKSSNRSANKFYYYLTKDIPSAKDISVNNTTTKNSEEAAKEERARLIMERNRNGNPDYELLLTQIGHEMHSSFLKYLEVVASRTPSQSMQSFMPMKIVAFDNPNINTAHVSTAQIWLLGSDYDVDAVSVATYQIDKSGKLPLWSPFVRLSDLKSLNESMKLPFPTGQSMNVILNNQDNPEFSLEATHQLVSILKKYGVQPVSKLEDLSPLTLFGLRLSGNSYELVLNENCDLTKLKQFLEEMNEIGELKQISKDTNAMLIYQLSGGNWGISKDSIFNLTNALAEIVNKHNQYLSKLSSSRLQNVAKNYSMYKMYKVIDTPMNLIQAQSSVDAMTGPLKKVGNASEADKLIQTRTPGNVFDKAESIEDNQVGKDGIGICAVGMKSFFGLTAYYNDILNNGTEEEQRRLTLDTNGITLYVPGKGNVHFDTFANINPKLKSRLYEAISQARSDTDAALILSALLSLATDNAKELQLSKLNAGTKTIGMYIYGISIGMDFNDVAKIMMSPIAKMITDLTKGNIFTGEQGIFSIDKAFDYIEGGPRDLIKEFDVPILVGKQRARSLVDTLAKMLSSGNKYDEGLDPSDFFLKFAWNSNLTAEDKIKKLESLKYKFQHYQSLYHNGFITEGNTTINTSEHDRQQFGQLIERIEDYVRQIDLVKSDIQTYQSIKTLSDGGSEFRILGQIFGLNQGLKTKPEEMLLKVFDILNIVYDREKAIAHSLDRTNKLNALMRGDVPPKRLEPKVKIKRFDLLRIAFNPDERRKWIQEYDNVKHTVNILDAVFRVPHFAGYIQSLATDYGISLETSRKFATMADLGMKQIDALGITTTKDKLKLFKGIGNYYSDYVRKCWMLETLPPITVPKGTTTIKYAKLAKYETEIRLGTEEGDASFKYLMENVIIPNLKKGHLGGRTVITRLKDNKFIKDLTSGILTNTVSKNPIIYYTLPINMMPSSDIERGIFNSYKGEFNKLSEFSYNLNGVNIPLTDLFYYYGLIAHYGKQGPQSIMPLFENLHLIGKLKEFHAYEATFDKPLPANPGKSIYPYILSVENPYTARNKYIYYTDPETMIVELWEKQYPLPEEDPGEFYERMKKAGAINNYVLQQNKSLRNDEVSNYMMSVSRQINFEETAFQTGGGNNVTIQSFNGDLTIKYNEKTLKGDKLNKMPKVKVNGETVDDLETLSEYIDLAISELNNECE